MKVKMILPVIISIAILACGNNESPVINHVLAPEPNPIKPNLSPPVIKKIVVPDQVRAVGRIILEAVAEDADGNALTYNWQAPGKLIYSKTTSIAIWTAPIDLGVATINVTVNDGIHEITKSADVTVIPSLIVPGEEVAGIRLGSGLNKVIHLYGEPTHQHELDVGGELITALGWDTELKWQNVGLTVYFRGKRVSEIQLSATNTAKTEGGNGIGSDCDEVRKEMEQKFGRNKSGGNASSLEPDEGYQGYNWKREGIEIRCRLSIVVQIVIRKPQK